VAAFLSRAAALRRPFKATAGLHHAIRAVRPLTYEEGCPRAEMHGFLNVFVAAAFAWGGMETADIQAVLEEPAALAFDFRDDALNWRGRAISTAEIEHARREFAHSFGSCSFEEPVEDLRTLGLLP
jgi:hypothetical protein